MNILFGKLFLGGNGVGYYVTVESGVKLYVEDINPEGSKTIVFLHGWPLSHKQFEYQFNVFPFRVTAVLVLTGEDLVSRISQ